MNIDSKLKRYIVLLDKAPFVLFLESVNYLPHPEHLIPVLKTFNLSFTNVLTTAPIKPDQDLRKIISATNALEEPLAYNIIEALATNTSLSNGRFFPKHYFTANDWQQCVEWQNVDNEPEPAPVNIFIITVDKFTHELSITGDANTALKEKVYEGVIHLESLDTKVPFPQALLKECVMEIYQIIMTSSIGRAPLHLSLSSYISATNTGLEVFYWIDLKKVEKVLTELIKRKGIAIEE